ncbi:hypothetical protein AB0H83_27155 [Dactylosporangium sp. NPDC050688]|uniref:hypothetical protein n=1 Tax=Dactylosporangium sp. NPDC050688 TaxID=3157217 RepID=UPI00340E1600
MAIGLLRGAAAGAAGSTALNAAAYLDMVVRARPASSTPERTVEAIVGRVPVSVPGRGAARENRVSGLAGLSGILTGVGVGAAYGALRRLGFRPGPLAGAVVTGLSVMAFTDSSMAGLGVSDPRTWKAMDWVSDVLPHLVYGAVTWAVLRALDDVPA